jgi:hypothetical protein
MIRGTTSEKSGKWLMIKPLDNQVNWVNSLTFKILFFQIALIPGILSVLTACNRQLTGQGLTSNPKLE